MSKYIITALLLVGVLTWSAPPAKAGELLRNCKVKAIEVYPDSIQVLLNFKAGGNERNVYFVLKDPDNPYVEAQLTLLRDALIFRKQVDVLVEDVKAKSDVLGVSLSQKTHD